MELSRFLLTAKASTYAAEGGQASVAPLLLDSKQLEYREGPLLYRDIYVGMLYFVGQEIVYRSHAAEWSMSYAGGLTRNVNKENAKATYAFLRRALRHVPSELPLRGPVALEEQGLRYTCEVNGSLDSFAGVEVIYCEGAPTYELHFSGGMLK